MKSKSYKLLNWIRKISVKKRIVYSFYITSIIPMIIIGFVSYNVYFKSVKDKISDTNSQSLLLSEINIKSAIERLESNSMEISFSKTAQGVLNNFNDLSDFERFTVEQELQMQSAQQFTLTYSVSDVILFTNNLDTITAYGARNRRLSVDKEFLTTLVQKIKKAEGKSVFVVVEKDNKVKLNKVVLLCRHVNDIVTGDRLGYIIVAIDASYFEDICKISNIGQNSYTMILDNYNTIIASNSEDFLSGENFQDKKLLDNLFLRIYNNIPITYTFHNEKYILSYKEIINDRWFMVSLIPYSYLNSETSIISLIMILVILICIASAVFFSEIISRSIHKPLKTTLDLIEKVNNGNLSVGEYDFSKDEVGIVNTNFNNMIKRLSISMDEIRLAEKEKLNMEWKALLAQINPHFLSNTLNSVKWLAQMQNADNIENITSALINILQDTMGQEEYITVDREIKSVMDYIAIQEYRYLDKFKITYNISPETRNLYIPKFILQPIVENAIIHGVVPKKGQGWIDIRSKILEERLILTVADNGVGISRERLEKILSEGKISKKSSFTRIGIKNVNERIKLKYGSGCGIDIVSTEGIETKVSLSLLILNHGEDANV